MTQANDERAARKEYIRRRQKTVFSIVGAVMVVAMVVPLLTAMDGTVPISILFYP